MSKCCVFMGSIVWYFGDSHKLYFIALYMDVEAGLISSYFELIIEIFFVILVKLIKILMTVS